LVKFTGRYLQDGAMVSYAKSGEGEEGGFRNEADSHIARHMRDDWGRDKDSKDGVSPRLFPLTGREQRKYRFALKGEETYQGAPVYRIAFEPIRHNGDERPWKGEALISKVDFEPLVISTKLAYQIPLVVRTVLGTNLPGLGFSVRYQKFEDGVWFPVSYGTEFRVHILHVYSRRVAISMASSDFKRTDVNSSVAFDPVQ
jgi:hypothetical protein